MCYPAVTFNLKSLYLLVHKLHMCARCTINAPSGIRPHYAPNRRPIVFSSNVYYVSRDAQLLSDWLYAERPGMDSRYSWNIPDGPQGLTAPYTILTAGLFTHKSVVFPFQEFLK
jgi:hypothetical protein